MSYNILDGGMGRIDPLAEVILAQNPDVLCLQEVSPGELLNALVARLRMHVYVGMSTHAGPGLPAEPGTRNLAILCREQPDWHQEIWLGGGRIAYRVDFKKPAFSVVTTHLSPYPTRADEARRLGELQRLLDAVEHIEKPMLLLGDFNSPPPGDTVEFEQLRENDKKRLNDAGERDWPREVVSRVLAAGFADMVAHHAARKDLVASPTFPAAQPAVRVDHCFANAPAQPLVQDAFVVDTRLGHFASDHLPIVADIDLPTAPRPS